MRLYHLTSLYHLPAILTSGYLKVTESNVSLVPHETHKGPDVVWLTSSRRAGQGWARMADHLGFVDKCRIVFELNLPDDEVHPWWQWALDHGSDEHDMRALAMSGDERVRLRGGSRDDEGLYSAAGDASAERAREQWFVIERSVPWLDWGSVTDQLAGTVIWHNSDDQMKAGEMHLSRLWITHGDPGHRIMVRTEPNDGSPPRPWAPTTIVSEETGAAVTVTRENARRKMAEEMAAENPDWASMTDAERRAYMDRVAPSVNVMRDLMGLDDN